MLKLVKKSIVDQIINPSTTPKGHPPASKVWESYSEAMAIAVVEIGLRETEKWQEIQ